MTYFTLKQKQKTDKLILPDIRVLDEQGYEVTGDDFVLDKLVVSVEKADSLWTPSLTWTVGNSIDTTKYEESVLLSHLDFNLIDSVWDIYLYYDQDAQQNQFLVRCQDSQSLNVTRFSLSLSLEEQEYSLQFKTQA